MTASATLRVGGAPGRDALRSARIARSSITRFLHLSHSRMWCWRRAGTSGVSPSSRARRHTIIMNQHRNSMPGPSKGVSEIAQSYSNTAEQPAALRGSLRVGESTSGRPAGAYARSSTKEFHSWQLGQRQMTAEVW